MSLLTELPRSALFVILPLLLLALVSGCAMFSGGAARRIGEIHLYGLPVAVTMPGTALPVGIGIRIYASEAGGTQGLPIQQGQLEVLMFDQPPTGLNPQTQKPLKVWTFPAADLAPFQSTTMIGTSYSFELRWDQARPKGRVVTVVARYRGPAKSDIYSTPTTIALTVH